MTVWGRKSVVGVLVLISVSVLLIFGLVQSANAPVSNTSYVKVQLGGQNFMLEVANTPEERQKGLSDRADMMNENGLLFEFSSPDPACFWMKDMKFNIDILWFDSDKKLIYQQQDVSPNTYPKNFCPPSPATYVIEVNPNLVDIKPGDELVLQKQ